MCWQGFLYGLLVMGFVAGVGWLIGWLEGQSRMGHALVDDEPLLSELDLLRIAKDYEGHNDVDLIIREVRRCWQQ
jgi:hypothetical protein